MQSLTFQGGADAAVCPHSIQPHHGGIQTVQWASGDLRSTQLAPITRGTHWDRVRERGKMSKGWGGPWKKPQKPQPSRAFCPALRLPEGLPGATAAWKGPT